MGCKGEEYNDGVGQDALHEDDGLVGREERIRRAFLDDDIREGDALVGDDIQRDMEVDDAPLEFDGQANDSHNNDDHIRRDSPNGV